MLLHNIIPHAHESELSNSEHQQIHQLEPSSPIGLLALVFHEFTEDGEMENIIVKASSKISFNVGFVVLTTINMLFTVPLIEEKESKQHFLSLDKPYQASGFSTVWSVRPPPFA